MQSQVRAGGKAALGVRQVGLKGCSTYLWQKKGRSAAHFSLLLFILLLLLPRERLGHVQVPVQLKRGTYCQPLIAPGTGIPTLWNCSSLTPLLFFSFMRDKKKGSLTVVKWTDKRNTWQQVFSNWNVYMRVKHKFVKSSTIIIRFFLFLPLNIIQSNSVLELKVVYISQGQMYS